MLYCSVVSSFHIAHCYNSIVARRAAVCAQEQEVARRERELDATIRKPADAERYRIETLAEANRYANAALRPTRTRLFSSLLRLYAVQVLCKYCIVLYCTRTFTVLYIPIRMRTVFLFLVLLARTVFHILLIN